jgi:hypothetical protein
MPAALALTDVKLSEESSAPARDAAGAAPKIMRPASIAAIAFFIE